MAYQTEQQLEQELLLQLQSQGFVPVKISDEANLHDNFYKQFHLLNSAALSDPLTDKEFTRLLADITGRTTFQAAKLLRDKFIFQRENGDNIYLKLQDTKDWRNNIFQVTHQTTVVGKHTNRYDVTVLMNGLPIWQFELKKRGNDTREAFNQVVRYKKDSYTGLYQFIQIFIISSGVVTQYFANSDQPLMMNSAFYWTDENNKRKNRLKDFTESFMKPKLLFGIINKYMVLKEVTKQLMVMRPYQIFAARTALNHVIDTNNNGYIWHSTGSGKTLTSFKLFELAGDLPKFKKVIHLVDRADLDTQTLAEFNAFSEGSVDQTTNTRKLAKQLKDPNKKRILTSIQKMNHLLISNDPSVKALLKELRDEHILFVVDECHRTQFGEMRTNMNRAFSKAQFLGFTGTPRLAENKSQDGRTTADQFGRCLHTYLMKDAIKDGNVLGLKCEYVSTLKESDKPLVDRKVSGINTEEVWSNDARLRIVVKDILSVHSTKTFDKSYDTMFTVSSIGIAVNYYDLFRELAPDLNVCTIFSSGQNEDLDKGDESSYDALDRIIQDYNDKFNTNFTVETRKEYATDVTKRMKRQIRNMQPGDNIDILIVVDMFLTGFDSPTVNTLYIDRHLQNHSLIQAASRTNRIHSGAKKYGIVRSYRPELKTFMDEAVRLFSQTDNANDVLARSYEEALAEFVEAAKNLVDFADVDTIIEGLESEQKQLEFGELFKQLNRSLRYIKPFEQFNFNDATDLMTEQDFLDYQSGYLSLYKRAQMNTKPDSVLAQFDFSIEEVLTDHINVDYILNLLKAADLSSTRSKEKVVEQVKKELATTSSEELLFKSEHLRKFCDQVILNLNEQDDIVAAFEKFLSEEYAAELKQASDEFGIAPEVLQMMIRDYNYHRAFTQSEMMKSFTGGLLVRKRKADQLAERIIDLHERYN